MENQLWKDFHKEVTDLFELYEEAQFAIALAEEHAGTPPKYIVGSVNELRAVLHHFMKAFQAFKDNPLELDWKKEFIKAKEEHLLRAIFDAHHISIEFQQKEILESIDAYDQSIITEVFPSFNTEIKVYFEKLKSQIASARTKRSEVSLHIFKEAQLKTGEYKVQCTVMIDALERRKQEKLREKEDLARKEKRNALRPWIIAFVTITIGGILAAIYREEIAIIYKRSTEPTQVGSKPPE